jgi:type IV secretory pathway VirB2 component (pilin)
MPAIAASLVRNGSWFTQHCFAKKLLRSFIQMNFVQSLIYPIHSLGFSLFQASTVPGQGLLDSISAFITGPFGKAITLIAIVLCGVSYMYGKQSDNANIGRLAIGAALIVGAANIFAYIQQAG